MNETKEIRKREIKQNEKNQQIKIDENEEI